MKKTKKKSADASGFIKALYYKSECAIFTPNGVIAPETVLTGQKWIEVLGYEVGNSFNKMFTIIDTTIKPHQNKSGEAPISTLPNTRKNGLMFSKIIITEIHKNKAYQARFNYLIVKADNYEAVITRTTKTIETTVSGKTLDECIKKTEGFLATKLKVSEYSVITKNKTK